MKHQLWQLNVLDEKKTALFSVILDVSTSLHIYTLAMRTSKDSFFFLILKRPSFSLFLGFQFQKSVLTEVICKNVDQINIHNW